MAIPPFDPASEPLGSTSPLVREVNSKLLDLGMHSKEDKFTDRFGEEKMTWEAMQNERIGLLIAGGQIFPSEAEGRAAAEDGWYYYAVSPDPNVTRSLYRRISSTESEHIKDDPSAEFVEGVAAASNAALDLASRPAELPTVFKRAPSNYRNITPGIISEDGRILTGWDNGFTVNQSRNMFSPKYRDNVFFALTDESLRPLIAVDKNRQLIQPWTSVFARGSNDVRWRWAYVDDNNVVIQAWNKNGVMVVGGGGGGLDVANLPISAQHIGAKQPWNNQDVVSVSREYPDIYSRDVRDDFPDHLAVYDYLDALMQDFPDYITMEPVGFDEIGNELRVYTFKPADYERTDTNVIPSYQPDELSHPAMVLITGTHGDEPHTVKATLLMLNDMCRSWKTDSRLEQLRWGIEIRYMPVSNPSGYDAGNRRNHNNVDLNRNFPKGWENASGGRGPEPASEAETQIILGLMETQWADACALVDYHRMFNPRQPDRERIIWIGADPGRPAAIAQETVDYFVSYSRKIFDFAWQENIPFGRVAKSINGSLCGNFIEFGKPGYLLESPNNILGTGNFNVYMYAVEAVKVFAADLLNAERKQRFINGVGE